MSQKRLLMLGGGTSNDLPTMLAVASKSNGRKRLTGRSHALFTTVDIKKTCMTLRTLQLEKYGVMAYSGHARPLASTVRSPDCKCFKHYTKIGGEKDWPTPSLIPSS